MLGAAAAGAARASTAVEQRTAAEQRTAPEQRTADGLSRRDGGNGSGRQKPMKGWKRRGGTQRDLGDTLTGDLFKAGTALVIEVADVFAFVVVELLKTQRVAVEVSEHRIDAGFHIETCMEN